MKSHFKYSIFLLLGLLFFLTSCDKETGPNHLPDLPKLTRSPVPLFTVDESLDAVIQRPEDFHAAFTLGLYFPDDEQPASCDIDVAMNGDYENIKKLETGITSFPVDVDVTGKDLADLFGLDIDDIKPGDKFELRASYTLADGTVLDGFADGTAALATSADLNNFPDANTSITYNAVCPLDLSAFVGQMEVVDNFFAEGEYSVTVTQPTPGILKVEGINFDPNKSVEIHVDTKTFKASIPGEVVSDTYGPYDNLTMTGDGSVDACNNVITLDIEWTVDQGSFGDGDFVLKQP